MQQQRADLEDVQDQVGGVEGFDFDSVSKH